ncbi:MAG: tetratricopeptide repeat protein [Burkholderiales bacterium]|nr:tetratricopeptide repeat protein [Burkholderiales bacterium]
MKTIFSLFLSLFLFMQPAMAADTSDSNAPPDLETAKTLIAKKDWPGAIASLEKFVKANPNDADGFNLLGYSLRNTKRYSEAIFNYKEALRIDPNHRGAHEYLGQSYVQTKQLDKAKELLASLEKICGLQCEEYLDLKKSIDKVKK